MMKNLQKMGGIAALYAGAAYVFAMVGYLFVLDIRGVVDPVQKVAFLVDNQAFLYILNLFVYVVWGVFMVVLALALYERLKAGSPAFVQTATAIGIIWACVVIAAGMVNNVGMETVVDLYATDQAQAATVWLAIKSVVDGLGGTGGETLGGTWILLVSWAALRAGELPRALNYLGAVIGVAGILSTVPALYGVLGPLFGVVQIVWFIWLGIIMLRSSPSTAAAA
jgi:hypothetical protein